MLNQIADELMLPGKLPATAGWQPALPGIRLSCSRSSTSWDPIDSSRGRRWHRDLHSNAKLRKLSNLIQTSVRHRLQAEHATTISSAQGKQISRKPAARDHWQR